MAASLTPCFSNRGMALCSWTNCPLQNGHQSAERKKRSTVPLGPFKESRVCTRPYWSCSANRYAVSRVNGYSLLRFQGVHHSVRVVIERQLGARCGLEALGGFGEGFVCIATAIHNGAGPCSGIGRAGLSRGDKRGNE